MTSINEGKPFVLFSPQTVIARCITALASEILGREAGPSDQDQNAGFLKRLFG